MVYPTFRTILAALHFNWNLNRESLKDAQGHTKLRVTYPKFKEGEATVREARVTQNYGMLFSSFFFLEGGYILSTVTSFVVVFFVRGTLFCVQNSLNCFKLLLCAIMGVCVLFSTLKRDSDFKCQWSKISINEL